MPAPQTDVTEAPRALTPEELAIIESWVQLADGLGLSKALARIYGLVFVSSKPVTAQDCVDALRISRSSAGQGLHALRDLGAIRPAFELGARREAFLIEPDLGAVLQGALRSRITPAFDTFFNQLQPLAGSLDPQRGKFLLGRMDKLGRWRAKLDRATRWLVR